MDRDKKIKRAMRALDDFRRDLADLEAEEIDCSELEGQLQQILNGIGCAVMGEVFERADTRAPIIEFEGERWGNRRDSPGTYTSKFGDFEITRSIYSRGGGGRVLVPVDVRLGIVERRYTPAVARVMARANAVMTAREAEGFLKEAGVATVSRSTLH